MIEAQKVHKIDISLLDSQVDVILKGLEIYCYIVNRKYKNRKVSISKTENLEKSLIRDTYHQILYCRNKENKKIL